MPFSFPGLSRELCRAAEDLGFKEPFPVQAEAIPPILQGKDVAAGARTGSGKTAAFLLPLLQRLSGSGRGSSASGTGVRALILVPTRELAAQVDEVAKSLARYLSPPPMITAIHGGVSANPQMMRLRGGADILIATPGRLLDLVGKNAVRLSAVEILVLDEADRMLDLGFRGEITEILSLLPVKRQTLLFSATLEEAVPMIASRKSGMDASWDPVRIQAGSGPDSKGGAAATGSARVVPSGGGGSPALEDVPDIEEIVYLVEDDGKGVLLRRLVEESGWSQVLVFVSSKRKADNVVRKLAKNGLSAGAMHGEKSQGARTEALAGFKQGRVGILVATDLASRGVDIENLPVVINYELPRSPADYIHRIGRTGRAGQRGLALSLVSPAELAHMKVICRKNGRWPEYRNAE